MQHTDRRDEHQAELVECTCRPQRVGQARDAVAEFLARLRPFPSPTATQDAVLLASELVTNAIRHAGAVTLMKLRADGGSIQVIVQDPSPALPQERDPDFTGRTGGFGWAMIQQIASTVAVQARPGQGKVIAATLPR
ncbi:ATP-binding protein [Streptomyces sp. NPDC002990]